MSPRTILQNEQIRQQKQAHIMTTALELFAVKGYHATSINDISRKAKISKGLLYNYFESKEELLESIISNGFNSIIESFDPNHDGVLTRDEFVFFLTNILDMLQKDKLIWRLYMSLLLQPAVHNSKVMEEVKSRAGNVFYMVRNYYREKGNSNPEADCTMLHMVMDGIFFNYLYGDDFSVNDIKKMLIDRFV